MVAAVALVLRALGRVQVELVDHVSGPKRVGVVHVKGVGRGSTVITYATGNQHIGAVIRPQAAMSLGDAQAQKTHLSQVVPVGHGKLGFAVVFERPLSPVRADPVDAAQQVALQIGQWQPVGQGVVVG